MQGRQKVSQCREPASGYRGSDEDFCNVKNRLTAKSPATASTIRTECRRTANANTNPAATAAADGLDSS